jgi:hypothetical protein
MTTTLCNGRLCNQIIRNIAVSLIAEKNDLYVHYCNYTQIHQLGIDLFIGNKKYENTISLTDDNYFSIYNGTDLSINLDPNGNYFQTKEITHFLYNYLHTDIVKTKIILNNPFKDRYNTNNDLYIHIRLTDTERFNPGINYYLNVIKNIKYDTLYISSDNIHHNIIKTIAYSYPATILNYDEIKTIQFASTCKNIILSHGSFSAVIGYLSFFSIINYPEYEKDKIWYGDMFSINGWIQHKV